MAKVNWNKAREFYVTSSLRPSIVEVAEKFGVHRSSVTRHSRDEGWVEQRERFHAEVAAKSMEERREQMVEENLDSLDVMQNQLESLTSINNALIEEFSKRVLEDGGVEGIGARHLLDAITKVSNAQDKSTRAISFLKGGEDSRAGLTFAELAGMSRKKKNSA